MHYWHLKCFSICMRISCSASLLITVTLGFALAGQAQSLSFTTIDLNGNSTLDNSANISGFPLGSSTYLGGVPFNQTDAYGQVWNASLAEHQRFFLLY